MHAISTALGFMESFPGKKKSFNLNEKKGMLVSKFMVWKERSRCVHVNCQSTWLEINAFGTKANRPCIVNTASRVYAILKTKTPRKLMIFNWHYHKLTATRKIGLNISRFVGLMFTSLKKKVCTENNRQLSKSCEENSRKGGRNYTKRRVTAVHKWTDVLMCSTGRVSLWSPAHKHLWENCFPLLRGSQWLWLVSHEVSPGSEI